MTLFYLFLFLRKRLCVFVGYVFGDEVELAWFVDVHADFGVGVEDDFAGGAEDFCGDVFDVGEAEAAGE